VILRFITGNENKVRELRASLEPLGFDVIQADAGYSEIQSDSLDDVVRHGLEDLRARGEDNIIIEDSGLFIDDLGGFPGVYSAYVFDTLGNKGILKLLRSADDIDRGASFKTTLGLLQGGEVLLFHGICNGRIAREMRGEGGFGYDPIFMPEGGDRAFGEMSREEKNTFSHRGRAAEELAEFLKEQG